MSMPAAPALAFCFLRAACSLLLLRDRVLTVVLVHEDPAKDPLASVTPRRSSCGLPKQQCTYT